MIAQTWNYFGLYFLWGLVGCALMTIAVAIMEGTLGAYAGTHEFRESLTKARAVALTVAEHMTVWMIWPLVLFAILYELYVWYRKKLAERYHSQFVLKPEHICGSSTIDEAESQALIEDPLGRVPALPFGHLNAQWKWFLAKGQPGFELKRAFCSGKDAVEDEGQASQWADPRGRREGYVWLYKRRIQAEFIFEWD